MMDLSDLKARYARLNLFDNPFWDKHATIVDLVNYRGQTHYIQQEVSAGNYAVATVYAEVVDDWCLVREMGEDGAFGALTFKMPGNLIVSRDLIDSALELLFLRKHLHWLRESEISALDIGAGYGRFAHRMCSVFPNATVTCVDGIPESTYVCAHYMRFRGVDRARVVPLDNLEQIADRKYHLAVNIHSWSECSIGAVRFWLDMVAKLDIPFLFFVPHSIQAVTLDGRNCGEEVPIIPEIESRGYGLIAAEVKYQHSQLAQLCSYSNAPFLLFQRDL